MTEMDYQELKDKVMYLGAGHGFAKMDCEDILHDAIVHILEYEIAKSEWKGILYKYIGKYRERRHREGRRQVEEYNIDKEIGHEPNIK